MARGITKKLFGFLVIALFIVTISSPSTAFDSRESKYCETGQGLDDCTFELNLSGEVPDNYRIKLLFEQSMSEGFAHRTRLDSYKQGVAEELYQKNILTLSGENYDYNSFSRLPESWDLEKVDALKMETVNNGYLDVTSSDDDNYPVLTLEKMNSGFFSEGHSGDVERLASDEYVVVASNPPVGESGNSIFARDSGIESVDGTVVFNDYKDSFKDSSDMVFYSEKRFKVDVVGDSDFVNYEIVNGDDFETFASYKEFKPVDDVSFEINGVEVREFSDVIEDGDFSSGKYETDSLTDVLKSECPGEYSSFNQCSVNLTFSSRDDVRVVLVEDNDWFRDRQYLHGGTPTGLVSGDGSGESVSNTAIYSSLIVVVIALIIVLKYGKRN